MIIVGKKHPLTLLILIKGGFWVVTIDQSNQGKAPTNLINILVGGTKRKSESQDIKTTEIANSRKRKKLSGGQPAARPKKAAIINSRPVMTARDGSTNNQEWIYKDLKS